MNVKHLIGAVAILAATGSAFADTTGNFTDFTNVPSNKTRAEVIAELKQARTEGVLAARDGADLNYATNATPRSRADVRAEAVATTKQQKDHSDSTYFGS